MQPNLWVRPFRGFAGSLLIGATIVTALVVVWYVPHARLSGIHDDIDAILVENGIRFQHVNVLTSSAGRVEVMGYLRSQEEVEQLQREIEELIGADNAIRFVRVIIQVVPPGSPPFQGALSGEDFWMFMDRRMAEGSKRRRDRLSAASY